MPKLTAAVMLSVEKMVVEECVNSQYVRPLRLSFIQNGKRRKWDLMKSHDSVAILIHHVERKSLLFVRQFRPAVYYNRVHKVQEGTGIPPPGTPIDGDLKLGLTIELCAGIIDKDKSLAQIAVEEIHEEVGYVVPVLKLEKVCSFRTGIGTTGSEQTIFYTEVTEAMRDTAGGGNLAEGEYIETVEIPVSKARDMIFNEDYAKPTGCAFAVMWFLEERYKPSLAEVLQTKMLGLSLFITLGAGVLAAYVAVRK